MINEEVDRSEAGIVIIDILDRVPNLADYVALRYYYRPISLLLLEEVRRDVEDLLIEAGYPDIQVRVSAVNSELRIQFVPEFQINAIALALDNLFEEGDNGAE